MIIWSGLGFLVAVIVFVSALVCNLAFDALFGTGYYSGHRWTVGVALLLAALASWRLGTALSRRTADRVVIDRASGKEIVLGRGEDRLFFIPVRLWGPILVAAGIIMFALEVTG